MKPYLGVFGHTALDVIMEVSELPGIDSSVAVNDRVVRYGGTGANIARAAAEMGVEVSLASFVGDDFPDDYMEALKESSVETDDLNKIDGQKTPTCWIINDEDGDQITFVDQGAMDKAEDFDLQKKTLKKSEIIHIGTGRPGYYSRIFESFDLDDRSVVFDPAQELEYVYEPDIFESFLKMSDYFFCNEKELEIALDYLDMNDPEEMLEIIDMLLVTKGIDGSTLYLPDEVVDIPSYRPEQVLDPTGAGDAFRAGFYAALYRGWPLEECCRMGSVRASFAVETAGPQENLVGWEETIERLEKLD